MTDLAVQRATAARRPWWRVPSARFWVCLAILAGMAAGMRSVETLLGVWFRKEELPLKRPLSQFDAGRLGPRYTRDPASDLLPALPEDQVLSLGTREYLQIVLADTTRRSDLDPASRATVFVTYYTGQPDKVPHVPEDCWIAAGAERVGVETVKVPVAGVGATQDEVPVRVVLFRTRRPEGAAEGGLATVMYVFLTNGGFATTRDEVRWALTRDLFQRYAYYAKVELSFSSAAGVRAGRDASLAALPPLLERLLPVLLQDHIDLEKFTAAGVPGEHAQK